MSGNVHGVQAPGRRPFMHDRRFGTKPRGENNPCNVDLPNNCTISIPTGIAAVTAVVALTVFHTLLSFIALILGLPVCAALMSGHNPQKLIGWFIATSAITTITGFFFPFHGFTPAIGVGIVCCLVTALNLVGRYAMNRRGAWRHVDTITLLLGEYFLLFVAIAQAFQKVPALRAIAPTGMETPFKIAQGVLFTALIVVAVVAIRARPSTLSASFRPIR